MCPAFTACIAHVLENGKFLQKTFGLIASFIYPFCLNKFLVSQPHLYVQQRGNYYKFVINDSGRFMSRIHNRITTESTPGFGCGKWLPSKSYLKVVFHAKNGMQALGNWQLRLISSFLWGLPMRKMSQFLAFSYFRTYSNENIWSKL